MGRRHTCSASWSKLINLFTVGIIWPYFFAQIQICHRFVIEEVIFYICVIFFEGRISMTINVERDFELVTLEITGRLDTTTAPNLEAVINEIS